MTDSRIAVTVDSGGRVSARRLSDNAESPRGDVGFRGLDADLVGLFERWLTLRDRDWRDHEIRTFGGLLHRCLFPEQVWSWIESSVREVRDRGDRVRLELVFPADPPWSRLAAVPWEYLYRPALATTNGYFLAARPDMVLSRYVPSSEGEPVLPPAERLRLLIVVSEPDDPHLGPVVHEETVAAIERAAAALDLEVSVLHDPTAPQLAAAVDRRGARPHLVHFMGHGEFDPDRGEARVALVDPEGGAHWLDDRGLAEVLTRSGRAPRAVVLHSCEGARADFSAGFAGLAPQLVRYGVQCVVAMQYPVTNGTAIAFSGTLYEQLAAGVDLDAAVQEARFAISRLRSPADPRLLGVPVIYLQNRWALLGDGGGREEGSGR